MDFIVDVTVIFSSYFFLQQLEYRFQTLNDSWEYLLPGFLSVPEELTHSITRITLDNIRLFHAELSDLLRIFSVGFGKMLLGFFVFSFINMILSFYYSIVPNNNVLREFNFDSYLVEFIPYLLNLQNVIWTLSIIIAASRVHEKKRKMISYLRLIKISNLSANLKTQVKFFMNQISAFESSELTACGIFNINLNLVVSILILLVTGLITIIQMKEHPVLLQSKENLKKFIQSLTTEKLNNI
ncbi:unnamed protein product [Macrosiphum euphorbiae]|nr:unnamed protein product [Macrosiphum euphorbiae]CAI6347782.1 unnamed protein product [Macrosiphum euphorbiae]